VSKEQDISGTERRRFRPYPEYKYSGVEWLGNIPSHWETAPIHSLARSGYKTFTDGDWIESPFIRDNGIRLIQTGNIGVGSYKEQGFRYIDEETFRAFRCTEVTPGDVLICRLADPVGRACSAPDMGVRMITSVDVCILKPANGIYTTFVIYALSGKEYLSWMAGICRGGTRDRVSRSMLGSIRIQKPPYKEQRAIATFLDRETAKIDALIEKKERLIELLQEKRTALITQAVTKGLNPNVPMKDSGIEWLGQIPAHWDLLSLKYCILPNAGAIKTGPFGSQLLAEDMQGEDVKVYNQRTVIDHDFSAGDLFISLQKFRELRAFEVYPGDVLVTTRGTIGRCAIVPEHSGRAVLHPCLMRIQSDPTLLLREYIALLIEESYLIRTQLALASNATTIDVIYSDTMRRILVPKPPLDEQAAILDKIEERLAKIRRLVEVVSEATDRLKEYRATLISAAVTGKIDVRDDRN
jgi:type I restriction enzyme S subunit